MVSRSLHTQVFEDLNHLSAQVKYYEIFDININHAYDCHD